MLVCYSMTDAGTQIQLILASHQWRCVCLHHHVLHTQLKHTENHISWLHWWSECKWKLIHRCRRAIMFVFICHVFELSTPSVPRIIVVNIHQVAYMNLLLYVWMASSFFFGHCTIHNPFPMHSDNFSIWMCAFTFLDKHISQKYDMIATWTLVIFIAIAYLLICIFSAGFSCDMWANNAWVTVQQCASDRPTCDQKKLLSKRAWSIVQHMTSPTQIISTWNGQTNRTTTASLSM